MLLLLHFGDTCAKSSRSHVCTYVLEAHPAYAGAGKVSVKAVQERIRTGRGLDREFSTALHTKILSPFPQLKMPLRLLKCMPTK